MQNLEAPVELDFKETNEEWEGKWLTEDAYDSIVHTKDYEYGVNIFSPASSFDPVPIATVIPNVYENRDHLVDTLNDINETSTMRANAAGPIDHDEMKAKGGSLVIVLIARNEGKASLVVSVSQDAVGSFDAVSLVRVGAEALGGKGGGGRPDMAQAGGPDADKAEDAITAIKSALSQ